MITSPPVKLPNKKGAVRQPHGALSLSARLGTSDLERQTWNVSQLRRCPDRDAVEHLIGDRLDLLIRLAARRIGVDRQAGREGADVIDAAGQRTGDDLAQRPQLLDELPALNGPAVDPGR